MNSTTMRTGVIGLGAMGAGMAWNLQRQGFLVAVWNRTPSRTEPFAGQEGIRVAASPEELAGCCELIVTCVSRDADVKQAVSAMRAGLAAGTIVADTSTINAATARELATQLGAQGVEFLDCPVSGGVEGARQGTLAMMVGGNAEALERARPALAAIARRVVHMGPSGSGQATKAVNQIMVAGINQAVTEALAFGEAMGLPMGKVLDVVGSGAAANWFLEHRGKSMLEGRFSPGFKVSLHHKDLSICRKMATVNYGASLPVTEMTIKDYQRLMEQKRGDEDISALFRLKQSAFKK
ncbi:MAG: NAD(P)-dependent oxidoreductase [Gammaproteobacteria bacterium]